MKHVGVPAVICGAAVELKAIVENSGVVQTQALTMPAAVIDTCHLPARKATPASVAFTFTRSGVAAAPTTALLYLVRLVNPSGYITKNWAALTCSNAAIVSVPSRKASTHRGTVARPVHIAVVATTAKHAMHAR